MRVCGVVFLLALGVVGAPVHPPESEFEVSFGTKKPLGLLLDQGLRVKGFQRVRADTTPPAEANGWVKVGDRLLAVNEEPVDRLPLDDVVRLIVKADLPKVLRFAAKNGENRHAEMARYLGSEGNFAGFAGSVELFKDGVPAGKFPFAQATFGRNTSCALARIVVARPADACGAFDNARELADAIVLVERGNCAFASKAMNVQNADGYGMIVVNDKAGPLFRLPQSPNEEFIVHIPSVLVSDVDGLALRKAMRGHHHSPILARLAPEFPACDAPARKPRKAEPAEPEFNDMPDPVRASPGEDASMLTALESLLDPASWPAKEHARRKLYFRLSKLHHPDVPGGSAKRFEILSQAYEAANALYGGGGAGAGVEGVFSSEL